MAGKRRLLAVFAHPDDEMLSCGGVLARLASEGGEGRLVCATRGEVGEISDPSLATPETLGAVREQELRCAMQRLGAEPPIFLGFRDSGMDGTPDNQHPSALVNADPVSVVKLIVEQIRRLKPQVVLTFEPFGVYGHPDHVAISKYTTQAFFAAGDPLEFVDTGLPWAASRLYYSTVPRELLQRFVRESEEMTMFTPEILARVGTPQDEITAAVDVSAQFERKRSAMECHATQFGPDSPLRRRSEEDQRAWYSWEWYVRVSPAPEPGERETDLFDGIDV